MARNKNLSVGAHDILEHLLRAHPEEHKRLQPYVHRAKIYYNECGCAMSGAFFVSAALLVPAIEVWRHGFFQGGPARLLSCAAFVLGAAIAGKFVGIAIARVRLALLYRDLRTQFALHGD